MEIIGSRSSSSSLSPSAIEKLFNCRICLQSENQSELINPCKCKGSMEYVHRECLCHWIESRTDNRGHLLCEICKHRLPFQRKLKRIWECLRIIKDYFKEERIRMVSPVVLTLYYGCIIWKIFKAIQLAFDPSVTLIRQLAFGIFQFLTIWLIDLKNRVYRGLRSRWSYQWCELQQQLYIFKLSTPARRLHLKE